MSTKMYTNIEKSRIVLMKIAYKRLIFVFLGTCIFFINEVHAADSLTVSNDLNEIAQFEMQLHNLELNLAETRALNNGRFDNFNLWLTILSGILLVIGMFTGYRTMAIARTEAREAFDEKFKIYCDLITNKSEEAEALVLQMRSHHETSLAITEDLNTAIDKILKKSKKDEEGNKK